MAEKAIQKALWGHLLDDKCLHSQLIAEMTNSYTIITDPHVNILSTFSVSDYHSVVVHLLNGTEPSEVDVRQFRERPPTLQYRVSLGNETFAISLRKNTNMMSSGCIIRHVNGSGHSTVSPCVEHDVTCYYTGATSAHNDSCVAASVFGGLKGLLSFGNTSLFIYPMKRTSDQTSTSPNHVMYRYQGDKHVCKTEAQGRHQANGMKTRYIEEGIVVDPPMARFHNENILQYVFTGFIVHRGGYRGRPSHGEIPQRKHSPVRLHWLYRVAVVRRPVLWHLDETIIVRDHCVQLPRSVDLE
ncbi:disintegrin and metalloproteinase domain-containing protein 12-like [Dreissena polymorpha]|uniref:disintegrin and metalloproteinase domain-containing protein 12-like n=1 Tax=Dreissena polymorpha TaxID=45954 RepID=UPI0022648070|nr:disintegrin and metalloproteinase domain-containing protein 12-like [Dreissena polymorpha]